MDLVIYVCVGLVMHFVYFVIIVCICLVIHACMDLVIIVCIGLVMHACMYLVIYVFFSFGYACMYGFGNLCICFLLSMFVWIS